MSYWPKAAPALAVVFWIAASAIEPLPMQQAVRPARLGVYSSGFWQLDRNGDRAADPAKELSSWGSPGDVAVVGDWNGDGFDELGVYAGGIWLIDRNGDFSFDPATEMKGWGVAGWTPLPGDWNGDGVTDLGVVSPDSTWFRDLNGDFVFDPATEILGWGSPGDIPIAGDFNGDGRDEAAVFSNGLWFIDFNGDGVFDPASEIRGWGVAGWTPLPGDWNGDGVLDLGVVSPDSTWFRDLNGDFVFDPATEILGWGSPGDTPIAADWNGDGKADPGVASGNTWFLDLNGNGVWEAASGELVIGFGQPGDQPKTGRWAPVAAQGLLRVNPADGESGVSSNRRVIVSLPEPVDPSSVGSSSVQLLQSGAPVAATRAVSADGLHISLRPDAFLFGSTEFEVVVDGLRTAGGAAIPGPARSRFTTASGLPTGFSMHVDSGQSNLTIPTNARFSFRILPSVDPTTWSRGALALRAEGLQQQVSLDCDLDAEWTNAECTTPGPLPVGSQLTLLTGAVETVTGAGGSTFPQLRLRSGFQPDTTPPQITGFTPFDGAVGYSPFSDILIKVSEPIAIGWPGTDIELRRNGVVIPSSVSRYSFVEGENDLRISTPTGYPLDPDTVYSVTVRKLFDAAGNAFSGFTQTGFTTGNTTTGGLPELRPASYASDLPLNAVLGLTFSTPLRPASVSPQTILLKDESGGLVPIDVTLANPTLVTIRPQNLLAPHTTYELRLDGVQRTTGLEYSPPSGRWTLRTGSAVDETAPAVLGVSPPPGATGVSTEPTVEVHFSEPIYQSPAGNAAVRIVNAGGTMVGSIASPNGPDPTVLRTVVYNLAPNADYSIIVEGFVDAAGNPAPGFTSSFRTGAGRVVPSPTVVATSPLNGAEGVSLNPVITIEMSEPLSPVSVNEQSVTVQTEGVAAPVTVELLNQDRTVRLTPRAPLLPNRQYSVQLDARSYSGFALSLFPSGPLVATKFTTGDGPADLTPPQVISMTPGEGSVIPYSPSGSPFEVSLVFSEPIAPASLYSGSILAAVGGTRLSLYPVALSADGSTAHVLVSYPHYSALPTSGDAEATVIVTTEVADLSGNSLTSDFIGRFRMSSELASSAGINLHEVLPLNNTKAPPGSDVSILFTAPFAPQNLDRAFYVAQDGVLVDGVFAAAAENRVLHFTPLTPFAPGSIIQVFGREGVRAADNPAGSPANIVNFFRFEISDPSNPGAPRMEQTGPARNSGSAVPPNVLLTARFSEPLDPATVHTGSVTLRDPSANPVAGAVSLTADGRVIEFRPAQPLAPGYHAVRFSTAIQDLSGVALESQTGFSVLVEGLPDNQAPAILAVSPPAGAVGVPLNAQIRARFSEPMNAPSIRPGRIELRKNGQLVPLGEVMVEEAADVFSVRPVTPLDPASVYTLSLAGAYDAAGRLAPDRQWSFSTGTTIDTAPPQRDDPAPFQPNSVGVGASFPVRFNETLDPTSPDPRNSGVFSASNGGAVQPGSLSFANQGRTLTFTPQSVLDVGTPYDLRFAGIRDLAGNTTSINQSFTTGFTVNDPAPSVVSSLPEDGATGVSPFAEITVTFSEPVNPASLTPANVRLLDGTTPVAVEPELIYLEGKQRLRLKLSALLGLGRDYTLEIRDVTDWLGGAMSAPYVARFNTRHSFDFVGPTFDWPIGRVSWDFGQYSGFSGFHRNIRAKVFFTERIAPASVRQDTISYQVDGALWPTDPQLDPSGKVVTLVPLTPLPPNKSVGLVVTQELTDLAGNPVNEQGQAAPGSFFTGAELEDVTAPKVANYVPADGATNVPVSVAPRVYINEPLDPQFPVKVRVLNPQGQDVAGANIYPPLQPNTAYLLEAQGGRDFAGNLMEPFSASFTTGTGALDSTPPSATASSPAPLATGVPVTTAITVDFSEPVMPLYAYLRVEPQTAQFTPILWSLSPDGMRLTITPREPLLVNTRYAVSFEASDASGNRINPNTAVGNYFWFTTGSIPVTPDPIPPTVLSVNPPDGATGVTERKLTITFSEPIHPTTLQHIGAYLDGERLDATVAQIDDGSTVELDLLYHAAAGGLVTVVVSDQVTDLGGNPAQPFLSRYELTPRPPDGYPFLQSVRPRHGARDVAEDAAIYLIFSQPLDPASAAGSVLASENGALLPGSIALSAGNQALIFTPDRDYAVGARIRLFVDLERLRNGSGESMGSYVSQSEFTVRGGVPESPYLELVRRFPPDAPAPRDLQFMLEFDRPLDPATVTADSVVVRTGGTVLEADRTLERDGRVLRVAPAELLPAGSRVAVQVSRLVRGLDGSMSASDVVGVSAGIVDQIAQPVTVTRLTPADGSAGVGVNAAFHVEFSGPINDLTVHNGTVRLVGPGGPVDCTFEFANASQIVTKVAVTPHALLEPSAAYTLSVDGVEDFAGRPVIAASTQFVSGDSVDLEKPVIRSFSPPPSDAPLNAAILVEFSEALDPATVSAASFALFDDAARVPGVVSLLPDSRTVLFEPDALLSPNTSHYLRLQNLEGVIRDLSGNEAFGEASFTTGVRVDQTPPSIVRALPVDGAQKFPLNGRFVVEFDRPMRQPTSGSSVVRVEKGGQPIPIRIDMLDGNRVMQVTPLALLDPFTPYLWTVEGVEDLAQNVLAAPLSRSVNSGASTDETAPTLASTSPTDQAVNFPRDGAFSLTFDEPVNADLSSVTSQLALQVNGQAVETTVTQSEDGITLTWTPVDPLPAQTAVSLYGFAQVQDLSGNRSSIFVNLLVTTGN